MSVLSAILLFVILCSVSLIYHSIYRFLLFYFSPSSSSPSLQSFRVLSVSSLYPRFSIFSVSSPPVLGTAVRAESITEHNKLSDTADAPFNNSLSPGFVNVQSVKLSHYYYKRVWMSVKKNADLIFPLWNIQRSHVMDLALYMR